jgi:ATP-binding cassette subfamily B protein
MNEQKDIDFRYNLKLYLKLLWRHWPLVVAALIVGLLLAAANMGDKLLFKWILDDATAFSASGDAAMFIQALLFVAVVFGGLLVSRFVLQWLNMHVRIYLDSRLTKELKQKFFVHLLGLSHRFHTTHKSGTLITRLNRGSNAVRNMSDALVFRLAVFLFEFTLAAISFLYFSWAASLVVIGVVAFFVLYSFGIQYVQEKHHVRLNMQQDAEGAEISDVFGNVEVVKYFGKEKLIGRRFGRLTDGTKDAEVKYEGYWRWLTAGQRLILGAGAALVMWISIKMFLVGAVTLGTLGFMYTIYLSLMASVFTFVGGIRQFHRAIGDFDALFEYAKIENEIEDKPGARSLRVRNGAIEFERVKFTYGEESGRKQKQLFDDFTLSIAPGEKVALVGHSGSGKSSLIKVLYRLYDIASGSVKIDGQDIRNVRQESLRSELSIVPQEAVLFDDTLYSNVAFSRPSATRDQVLSAIESAQLHNVVARLPKGVNTIVGERGVKLSGGERQRVSIARALLANRKILMLDEATSSLDSRTEWEIQQALDKLLEGRTSIIVAHRLSTIMRADKIVVMDEGRIVQQGTHRELIAKRGVYKELWDLQKGGYLKG